MSHDGVKAARLPEDGHQQNPRNRSYLINPNHPMQLATWSSLTHLNSIPAYSILTLKHTITWSMGRTTSTCNFRLNFVEMSRRKDMHMPLLQWQHWKAVYKAVPGCAMLWDRNEFGFRDEHCRLQIFIFMHIYATLTSSPLYLLLIPRPNLWYLDGSSWNDHNTNQM